MAFSQEKEEFRLKACFGRDEVASQLAAVTTARPLRLRVKDVVLNKNRKESLKQTMGFIQHKKVVLEYLIFACYETVCRLILFPVVVRFTASPSLVAQQYCHCGAAPLPRLSSSRGTIALVFTQVGSHVYRMCATAPDSLAQDSCYPLPVTRLAQRWDAPLIKRLNTYATPSFYYINAHMRSGGGDSHCCRNANWPLWHRRLLFLCSDCC